MANHIGEKFRAPAHLQLKDSDAALRTIASQNENKAEAKAADKLSTLALAEKISEYQNILYGQKQHKVLIILQGMDTSGKDGTIRGVFGQINPLGAHTVAFAAPNNLELAHDYLWRVHQKIPAKGELVIFNRSHYEDVLITQVRGWIDQAECQRRLAHIRDFERMLSETGTVILKFFLHISKAEQKQRLEERLSDSDKNWKFDPNDLVDREHWDEFQSAYSEVVMATDSHHAPWYIIPADSKTQRNLAIAHIVTEKLESMKLAYPPANPALSKIKVI
ncbi:PPK2 family polyphosphate kinase [Undibacterium sp. Ren11W]|uniref:PPK2 family polyphosphate kinase n=1 Tax=Undibacterium sp. Ren11W TaxID=3413045 RepID=UPI003BF3AF94